MSKTSGRIGVLDLVFASLIIGKLFRVEPVASWSWWVVLAPVWILLVALVFVAMVLGLREVARRW